MRKLLSCLEHSGALGGLTLHVDFLTVLLRRSLFSALPCSLSLILSLSYFSYQDFGLTLVLRVPAVNPGRKSGLRSLETHFLSKTGKKQARTENRPDLPWTSCSEQGSSSA